MIGRSPRRMSDADARSLRTVRRNELRRIVPLADTTIYELEQRGEFPRRFNLTARCVVWDLREVEAWLAERRRASEAAELGRAPFPDVRKRRARPVAGAPGRHPHA
jgi:prophage regulatory protein